MPEKNMKKRILALTLALAVLMSGCSKTGGEKLDTKSAAFTIEKDGKTVAAVSQPYAWMYTLIYKTQFESFFGNTFWDEKAEDGATYEEMFKQDLVDEIKRVKVLGLEAKENGVKLSDEEKDICASNAEGYLSEIEEETLKKTGITKETLAEYEEDYILYDKYKNKLLEKENIEIDEEDVRQSDLFTLRFETLVYDDETGEEKPVSAKKKAAQKKKAEEAYAMLQNGEDIEDVAEKFDMDPDECTLTTGRTAEADKDEYYDEAFENAAFSLKEGEYSKVVEGRDGYYIIQMVTEENEEETMAALENAEQTAAEELFTPILEEIEGKYEVTMNEENWDKISFKESIAFKPEEELIEEESTEDVITEEEPAEEDTAE